MAMMASIGAAAKRGLLIKGSKYLETLIQADVLLIDKTGTLTLGRPHISDQVSLNSNLPAEDWLQLMASAERYSEHPLAEAVRIKARELGLQLSEPQDFEALPGMGLRARVDAQMLEVGSRRMLAPDLDLPEADKIESQWKTLMFVRVDGILAGFLAAADRPRLRTVALAVFCASMTMPSIQTCNIISGPIFWRAGRRRRTRTATASMLVRYCHKAAAG